MHWHNTAMIRRCQLKIMIWFVYPSQFLLVHTKYIYWLTGNAVVLCATFSKLYCWMSRFATSCAIKCRILQPPSTVPRTFLFWSNGNDQELFVFLVTLPITGWAEVGMSPRIHTTHQRYLSAAKYPRFLMNTHIYVNIVAVTRAITLAACIDGRRARKWYGTGRFQVGRPRTAGTATNPFKNSYIHHLK